MQTELELIPGVTNHRLGRVRGDDGLERIVRSFHFRIRSVKCGDPRATARTRVAYVLREGKYEKDAGDVEASAGDREKLLDAADRIEETSRIKTGRTAERILQSFVQELPAESTPEQRQACADAIVEHWRTRYGEDRPGHEAIAVVHVHGAENPQAHLHIEVAARPILPDGAVDRSVRLWGDRASCGAAFRAEREAMAGLVNRVCDPEIEFHAGTFREMGREDEGKPRLPISKYRKMRAEIAEASTPDEEAKIERRYYEAEAKRREDLHAAGTKRAAEIAELKEAGEWRGGKRIGVRERLARRAEEAEEALRTKAADYDDLAAVATEIDGERRQAEGRVAELELAQVEPIELTDAQRAMLGDVCGRHGIEGGLDDAGVQLRAFAALHEEREKRRRRDKARQDGGQSDDERRTGEAAGQDDLGGRAAARDRRGGELEGGGTPDRAAASPGGDGDRGAHRGAGARSVSPPAAPPAPVEPEVLADGTPAGVVDQDGAERAGTPAAELGPPPGAEDNAVAGGADAGGADDRRPAIDRLKELDDAIPRPRRQPDLAGDKAAVVAVKPEEGRRAIDRLRELRNPESEEPPPKPPRQKPPSSRGGSSR